MRTIQIVIFHRTGKLTQLTDDFNALGLLSRKSVSYKMYDKVTSASRANSKKYRNNVFSHVVEREL